MKLLYPAVFTPFDDEDGKGFVVEVPEKNIYSGMRILNHDLLLGFRKLGVECPFPQLDVHNR